MIPFCLVHVGQQSNVVRLLAGDIKLLERLLGLTPTINKLDRGFDTGGPIRLTTSEARQLLAKLRKVDLAALGDEQYSRSTNNGVEAKKRELITGVIEFLEG